MHFQFNEQITFEFNEVEIFQFIAIKKDSSKI